MLLRLKGSPTSPHLIQRSKPRNCPNLLLHASFSLDSTTLFRGRHFRPLVYINPVDTPLTRRRVIALQMEAAPLTENPLGPPLVLCVGEVLYDLLSSSSSSEMSERSQWFPQPGGATANVASALAKLGTASAFIGNIGDDQYGHSLKSLLQSYNVNVDGVFKVPGRATRQVFVRRDDTGERAFVGFGGSNTEFADACALDPEAVPSVLFYAAQVLVTPTLSLAFPESGRSLQQIVDMAKMRKLRVVVDVNWRPIFWDGLVTEEEARNTIQSFVKKADIVKISIEEVQFLYGKELAAVALEQPEKVLRHIGGTVSGVLITAGSEGAAFAFETGLQPSSGRIIAEVAEAGVVDTTGAGDAFLGGFLSEMMRIGGFKALSNPDKIKEMATFAAKVASVVVSAPGSMTSQPSREIIESAVQK